MHHLARRMTGAAVFVLAWLAGCSGSSADLSRVPNARMSTITFDPPTLVADNATPTTMQVIVMNGGGHPLEGATVTVTPVEEGTGISQPGTPTDANGMAMASVTAFRTGEMHFTITVAIDGHTYTLPSDAILTVMPGEPDPTRSTISASPTTLVADGTAASTITLRVADSQGNVVPGANATWTLSGADAQLGSTSVTTDANGEATTTLTATRYGPKIVGADVAAGPLTQPVTVTFTPIVAADETEPNDAPAQAMPISLGTAAYGDVTTAGDVDYWAVPLHAGDVVAVEVWATRFDHSTWEANGNSPRLTVWNADGSQKIVEHDYSGNDSVESWSWDQCDLDLPRFRAESDGVHLISVTQDDASQDGGRYALVVRTVDTGALQGEGTTITGSTRIFGFHVNDEPDLYRVTVTQPSLFYADMLAYRLGVRHLGAPTPDYYDPLIRLAVGAPPEGGSVTVDEMTNDDDSFYDSGIGAVLEPGDYTLTIDEYPSDADAPYFTDVTVLPLETTAEVEDNNTPANAQPITPGQSIRGTCFLTPDTDVYSFEAQAGDIVTVEVFDPAHVLPTPQYYNGRISVEVLDPQLANRPLAESYGVPRHATVLTQSGTHYVRLSTDTDEPDDYVLRVSVEHATPEAEPNDTIAEAGHSYLGIPVAGVIDSPGDEDTFAVTVDQADQLVSFSLVCQAAGNTPLDGRTSLGSALAGVLSVWDAEGNPMVLSDSTLSPYPMSVSHAEASCELAFRAPAAGTYFVKVSDKYVSASSDHFYVLRRTN